MFWSRTAGATLLAMLAAHSVAEAPPQALQTQPERQLVQVCFGCHNIAPQSSAQTSIPALPLMPADALYQRLRALQTSGANGAADQTTGIMGRLLRGYTDAELQSMAKHLGAGT